MSRISPAPPERYSEVSDHMERWQKTKGYPPNSWLTLLRKPGVFRAYRDLHTAVMMDEGEVPRALKFMIAYAVSTAAGDPYCAAHNAENATHIAGVPIGKVEALLEFRTNPLFSAAERAALELACAAGSCPPEATDSHFAELKKHYSEDGIIEIVSVIALLGWLTRWNVTLATRLEAAAAEFAVTHLAPSGWKAGVHGETGDSPQGATR